MTEQAHRLCGRYVAVDIETTGLDFSQGDILEIGAVEMRDGQTVRVFDTLIKPNGRISPFITRLTGITNEMVADAPDIKSVLPLFYDFIQDLPLLGHNISFDMGFLSHNCARHLMRPIKNSTMDTMYYSRRLFSQLPNHKLETLVRAFGLADGTPHRAAEDARLTALCYEHMKRYAEKNDIDLAALCQPKYPAYVRIGDIRPAVETFNENHPLFGKTCVFTGTLQTMGRREAMQRVADAGGKCASTVNTGTDYLIVGKGSGAKSSKQIKAEQLAQRGQDIVILSEGAFCSLAGDAVENSR